VNAVRQIYAPAKNPRTGEEIWPGLMRGSELGWAAQAGGPAPIRLATDFFKYLLFEHPNWDWQTLDFDRDVATATKKVGPIVTTMNPDLEAFSSRGGKLILYHGWNDQAIAPGNSVKYYTSVVDRFGRERADQFARLFMAPGVAHCRGGPGPDTFDAVGALEAWVESGVAPNSLIASRVVNGKVDRTRPLCSYPQVAVYKGSGSTDDAAHFECRVPVRWARSSRESSPARSEQSASSATVSTVTREELRQRLWPAETFVDFAPGLNAAVRRLRDALGDSAQRTESVASAYPFGVIKRRLRSD
jgi:feruloyl esterase